MSETKTKGAGKGNRTAGPRPRYNTQLTFNPIAKDSMPSISRSDSPTGQFLQSFVDSGAEAAEVPVEGRPVEGVRGNLASYADRHNVDVTVRVIGGKLFLVRGRKPKAEAPASENGSVEPDAEVQL